MPTITIDTDDLSQVVERVLPFRSAPEANRPALQAILVSPAPDGLRWIATDSYRMACLYRGRSDLTEPVLVHAELVDFAVRHAIRNGLDTVPFRIDDDHEVITLDQPELRVPRHLVCLDHPDVDASLFGAPDQNPAVLQIDGENLRAAVHATVTFTASDDDRDHAVALRSATDDTLHVRAQWPDGPDTHAFLPATSDAAVDTVVNARFLHSLLDAAGAHAVELIVGSDVEPLRIRSDDGFYGLLMPLHLGQPDLERRIADHLGLHHADLTVRDDGSIPIVVDDTVVDVRLIASPDPFGRGNLARFAVLAAAEVPETPEVLQEVNQLNGTAVLCRVVHDGDAVFVESDNLLATLDDEEIDAICDQLVHHARDFGPLIEAVHQRHPGQE